MPSQRADTAPAPRGLSPKSRLVAAAAQRQGPGQRAAQENREPLRQAQPAQRGSTAGSDEAHGCIPAFRPPSPPQGAHQLLTPGSECGSPGLAQLEAVRALRPSASMQQQQQQGTPEGTPGLSEASSVGRAINAQIASSIADLFGATPQPEAGSNRGGGAIAAAADTPAPESQWTAERAWAPQLDAPQAAARVPASPRGGQMPVPPPMPLKLATAMRSDSGRLEPRNSPQAFLSPVFMSRKQRSMYCDIDDPVSSVVFPPKAPHRTGRVQRWFATAFGCFVPPPEQRSPARQAPGLQAPSPAVVHPKLAYANTEPLRRSLPDLAGSDAALRDQLRASLAAEAASQGSRGTSSGAGPRTASTAAQQQQAHYADLLGLHEEETQQNMASPVLPSRHGSRASTPAASGPAAAAPERSDSLARRNLMDAPRYSQAGSTSQQQRRQAQYVHPQQSLQHAARLQRSSSDGAGKAKATHVSLAQLLGVPTAGAAVAAVAAAASGWHAQQPKQAQRTPPGMRRNNSGSKRGREALGTSRHPSDDTTETPKRRDLSKPSYRSEALHRLLSTPPRDTAPAAAPPVPLPSPPQPAAAGPALPPGRPSSAQHAVVQLARVSSAPASPLHGGSAAGSRGAAKGSSAPASPLVAGPRLNRAASVRAAATQRRLQEQQAQLQVVMARSPDRWLRAAAAQGLSLRQAAVFVSPGKSARPHYHPSPLKPSQPAPQRAAAGTGGPGLRTATPGASRFDAFAAGEAGVEPYSARMHTVERRRLTAADDSTAQAAAAGGGALDFAALAADRDAYLQMLQELARGLHVSDGPARKQLEAHKRPTPPPLPADVLAAATSAARAEQAVQRREAGEGSGADTVRARGSLMASRDVLPTSRTTGSAAEYCLGGGEPSYESYDSPLVAAAEEPRSLAHLPVPQPPHFNRLYDRDTTPSQSSPIAQQRMLTMSAAAVAAAERQQRQHSSHHVRQQWSAQQQPQQQPPQGGGGGSGHGSASSSADRSISFGSGGCGSAPGIAAVQQVQEQSDTFVTAPSTQRSPSPDRRSAGRARLAALAALLEEVQSQGRRITLTELRQAGYSTNDLHALRQWLGRQ